MKNLCETRKEKNVTQEMLEEMSRINQTQISKIERGLQKPNDSTRQKLESVLGKIDWTETTGTHLSGDYHLAERLINKLIGVVAVLNKDDKKAVKRLIHKYFK